MYFTRNKCQKNQSHRTLRWSLCFQINPRQCFERKGWWSNAVHLDFGFERVHHRSTKRRKVYWLMYIINVKTIPWINGGSNWLNDEMRRARTGNGIQSVDHITLSLSFRSCFYLSSFELIEFIIERQTMFIISFDACDKSVIWFIFVDFKIEELYYVEIEYEKYVWIKICRTLRD